jgi:hypothetical protein
MPSFSPYISQYKSHHNPLYVHVHLKRMKNLPELLQKKKIDDIKHTILIYQKDIV